MITHKPTSGNKTNPSSCHGRREETRDDGRQCHYSPQVCTTGNNHSLYNAPFPYGPLQPS